MNSFESKVYSFIKENDMISPGSTVLAGFSGGADSTAMVLVLYELRKLLDIRIVAVHINHRIREEAGTDADFVRDFCKEKEIECHIIEKDIPKLSKEWKMTEEEAGRKARYEAFDAVSKQVKASYIAIAHHQSDVAETLLMNLFRGSGLHGAGAIRPVRGNIIRPLLGVERREIEEYLQERGQLFCHDATNDENIHTRNIIRNSLIPMVEKEINSAATLHLFKAAREFARADEYVSGKVLELYNKCVDEKESAVTVHLDRFRDAEDILKSGVILRCMEVLTPARKDISSSHIDAILELSKGCSGTASTDLPYGLIAVRSYDELKIKTKDTKNSLKGEKEFKIPSLLNVGDEISFDLPNLGMAHIKVLQYNDGKLFPSSAYTKWFDYDRIQEAVFRRRKAGDYILLEHSSGLQRKAIPKLMTDEKIPRLERDGIYLLADGSNVLWVPGYRMSGAFKINEGTQRILEVNIYNGGF